jgi:glycosyltransferase involved in cell wall biosynthesis
MPFFTVITPTFNRAPLLEKTIHSVLAQNFTDFELIIVDDGSTDNTKELVTEIKDDRVKYIYQENGERGKARNTGTKNAKGKYVFFLDSDDLLYINHLNHAFEKIKKMNSPEFFHSRYENVYGSKKIVAKDYSHADIWARIQKQNKFACQFFLRRDIATSYPFSENRNLKIGEDWLLLLQIGQNFPLNYSNEIHSAIVHHQNRSMIVSSAKNIIISRDIITKSLNNSQKNLISNVYFELTSLAALSAAIQNERAKSISLIFKLFLNSPFKLLNRRRTLATIKHLLF